MLRCQILLAPLFGLCTKMGTAVCKWKWRYCLYIIVLSQLLLKIQVLSQLLFKFTSIVTTCGYKCGYFRDVCWIPRYCTVWCLSKKEIPFVVICWYINIWLQLVIHIHTATVHINFACLIEDKNHAHIVTNVFDLQAFASASLLLFLEGYNINTIL